MASSGAEGERLRQRVDILYDPADDRRLHDAIRRRCRGRRDHLVVGLAPELPELHIDAFTMPNWTLLAVYQALGEPPRLDYAELFRRLHRPSQLPLFTDAELGGEPTAVPEPPSLFSELDLVDRIARRQTLARYLDLDEVGDLLIRAGIRHLYVLQAEALTSRTWHWLYRLVGPGGIRLHLVVGGRGPMAAQLLALEDCRIRRRTAPPSGRPLWWDRPSYRSSRRPSGLPERMTMPRRARRVPRAYDRAIPAPKSHAPALHPLTAPAPFYGLGDRTPQAEVCPALSELAPKELWERFRTAAQALVADNAERSFISILPPPEPSPDEMAARRERTRAAFAKLVARMGDRLQEFFPIAPPGGRAGGDGGREEDQER